jgi:PST family polysaccharide transporter
MTHRSDPKPGRAIASLPWTIVNSGLQLFSKVLILVVLSRVLTPAEFGQFYIGMAVVAIVGTLAVAGIPTNMIYLEKVDRPTVAAALWVGLATSVSAGGLVWIAGRYYFDGPDEATSYGIASATACYLPVFVVMGILEALSRRHFRFKLLAMAELSATMLGSFLVALVLALAGWGVWALVAGQAVYGRVLGCIRVRSNLAPIGFRTRVPYFRMVA